MQNIQDLEEMGDNSRILENLPRRIFPRKYFERD